MGAPLPSPLMGWPSSNLPPSRLASCGAPSTSPAREKVRRESTEAFMVEMRGDQRNTIKGGASQRKLNRDFPALAGLYSVHVSRLPLCPWHHPLTSVAKDQRQCCMISHGGIITTCCMSTNFISRDSAFDLHGIQAEMATSATPLSDCRMCYNSPPSTPTVRHQGGGIGKENKLTSNILTGEI